MLLVILSLLIVTCGIACARKGFVRTPSDSSALKGQHYLNVVALFMGKGFTNIETERIEDLIDDGLTTEGAVEDVSVGGNFYYLPNKLVSADTEVVIRYHAFTYIAPGIITSAPEDQSAMEQELLLSMQENLEGVQVTFNEETKTYEIIPIEGESFMATFSETLKGADVNVAAWKEFSESVVMLSDTLVDALGPGYSVSVFDPGRQNTLLLIIDGQVLLDFVSTDG